MYNNKDVINSRWRYLMVSFFFVFLNFFQMLPSNCSMSNAWYFSNFFVRFSKWLSKKHTPAHTHTHLHKRPHQKIHSNNVSIGVFILCIGDNFVNYTIKLDIPNKKIVYIFICFSIFTGIRLKHKKEPCLLSARTS